ncbi:MULTISPECIES: SGNH/GDSL hydrolase family protein [unclassified Streptomyces]|uniref:SGNH/GDSL hydrolase family protein n=1 Tax=unclassified Streptomyces TaxID=2593676 RepID=UPI00224D7203|nr:MULTISPECIES: GDSL-type esterase/lipase family protein [unclassified Streptomyces]WSU26560.1 GDSL-type esterase/lipase family protein [Streptomyces sp. NBC_01108]MCX4787171.1 GDSL-type esterase/lipase family protein [Streptomyces sp. NBC_01221]MCX4797046.1 GDSL-type esterase/lipase family protein [Streptomyces sp. NBC_01242]WSJ41147.1 GDSL-type esterase/lipase family protein [Streptomyces sp. NBC_01321]WSP67480.1 GDSL-type esterase/lipase family protein [Streptomyces sp. NBC_01240]
MARRIAAGAAYGGGSIGLLGAAAVGVLLAEVQLAKRLVGGGIAPVPPNADGRYGVAFTGPADPLRLGLLGDSTAAGQGVRRAGQTPGALLASGLAAVSERPVDLRNVAQPGARSDDLERQVSLLLADPSHTPDVCVIMIGANDVTHRMPATQSVRCLTTAVRRLRTAGAEVVVGTCPDLGTIEPVYQPLRWMARRVSRQLAAAQTIGSVEQGGRTVSLGDLLGPEFEANPRELFGPDNYHPSAEGYATAAMALLPTLCAVLGLWPETDRLDGARREDMLPVAEAASQAAREAGTEVTGARAPWALLKHRRRRRLPAATEPQPHPETEPAPATEPMASSGPHEEPLTEPLTEPREEPRPEPSGESHGEPHGESRNLPAN